MVETKQQILDDVCDILRIERWRVSRGSTEPRDALRAIARSLGIAHECSAPKTEIARLIVESAGLIWMPRYESTGSTVTKSGLIALRTAVRQLAELS
jgi:hypothetical protein